MDKFVAELGMNALKGSVPSTSGVSEVLTNLGYAAAMYGLRNIPYPSRKTGAYVKKGRKRKTYAYRPRARRPNSRKKFFTKLKRRRGTLTKKVRKLARRVEAGMGTYIYKERDSGRLNTSVNGVNNQSYTGTSISTLEAAIDALPVFNPALPGTFTTVDFTSGTQQKEVEFASTYTCFRVKNNYDAPVTVYMYCIYPKSDTSITGQSAYTQGLNDVGITSAQTTTSLLVPSDSPQFRDLWKVKTVKKVKLGPGQMAMVSNTSGSFQYDPSFVDSHALSFQSKYRCHQYYLRVEGELAHDSSASEFGRVAGGVDYELYRKYVVKYDAGADITNIEVVDGNDSFTNGGVVSQLDTTKETYSVN